MAKLDFEKMSIEDLKQLKSSLEHTLERRREQERADLKKKMVQMAEEAGYTIDDLFSRVKGKKPAIAAKYRNPDNASDTWSGRGRKPRWLAARLAAGESQDSFLID